MNRENPKRNDIENGLEWIELEEEQTFSEDQTQADGRRKHLQRNGGRSRRGLGAAAAVLSALLLTAALVPSLSSCGSNNAALAGLTEKTAEIRDLENYRSFSGTINPVDYRNVYPDVSGVKVRELLVEAGDEVHAGDVLIELNPEPIQQQIDQQEAQLAASGRSASLSVQQAQNQYNNYKYNLDNNLDSQMLGAQQAIDGAFAQLVNAQRAFNNEVGLNNQGFGSNLMTAMQGVDSSYQGVRNAQLGLQTAQENNADTRSAELALDGAWQSYNQAVANYNAAKIREENSLTGLYDSLVTAQFDYLNTIDNYNAAANSSRQQLNNYALQVESARAQADQTASQITLNNLYKQIGYCTITAPMDGVVTSLPVKVGDSVTQATLLATVTSFDTMKVDIKINEYDIGGVTTGSPVSITLDATGKVYEDTIASISRVAEVQNGVSYFTSEVEFPGDEDARSGMSAEVKLVLMSIPDVVAVPSAAVQTEADGTSYVLVPGEGREGPQHRTVLTGETDGTYIQIVSGLEAGETYYETASGMYPQMNVEVSGPGDGGRGGNGPDGNGPQDGDQP
ncbi:MAG: efflux RND transporter periplasmic adaptor subunit [Lachnospiraceae bacterium]|nr:efflux RND transporter periplasmic adaptor subunit [Lachnospiraceae bacterium]